MPADPDSADPAATRQRLLAAARLAMLHHRAAARRGNPRMFHLLDLAASALAMAARRPKAVIEAGGPEMEGILERAVDELRLTDPRTRADVAETMRQAVAEADACVIDPQALPPMAVFVSPQGEGILLKNLVAGKGVLHAQAQGKDVTLRQKGSTWTAWCEAWRFPRQGSLLAAPPAPDPRRMRPAEAPLDVPASLPESQEVLLEAERPHLRAAARVAQARHRARDVSDDAQSRYVGETASAVLDLLARRADAFLAPKETTLQGAVGRAVERVLPGGDPLGAQVAARVHELMAEAKARVFDLANPPAAATFVTGTGAVHRVTDFLTLEKSPEKWISSAEKNARRIAMGRPILEGISEAGRAVFLVKMTNEWIMTSGLQGHPVKGSLLSQDPLPEPAPTEEEAPDGP